MKKIILAIGLLLMVVTAYAANLSDKDHAKFTSAVKAFRTNQNAEALRLFTELHKDYPENQQIKNNYAVVLFADGKIEKAEEVLSGVIESNKEVSVAFNNLNKIYDYAAAKAYSNALGTEKEVVPQKLQLIDVLTHQETEYTLARVDKTQQKVVANATPSVVDTQKTIATEINLPTASVQVPSKPEQIQKNITNEAVKDDLEQIITKNVNDWAGIWSKGDVNAYVAFYKANFSPDKNTTHKQWLENRKSRISPQKNIRVTLSNIVITPDKASNDVVVATFKQDYQANHYKDNTSKQLVWRKSAGSKWLIEKEIVQ